VIASPAGLAHLVATADGSDSVRLKLLRDVFDERWRDFVRTVERHRREIGRELSEQLIGDAEELRH
jgi:hypothetical protein